MENEAIRRSAPFHVFARLLSGDTKTLLFNTPRVCARAVKERIFDLTRIPISQQRLIYGGHQIEDSFVIPFPDSTVHLCLRLRGGKGGFGSLLRGAATKAGQKKTNNFDACRDMSGRRLRHVNAEKKLEEWKAEAEERKLEKIAEEFLKKASKKGKKGVGDGEAEKYVEKYRKDSAACVARVELSVREAVGSSGTLNRNIKRKLASDVGVDGKKLKIWRGKRKVAESDDDMDEDSSEDDEENEKSVVLDKPNSSDSVKDGEISSDSMTGGRQDEEIAALGSSGNGPEEEKETTVQEISNFDVCMVEESVSHENNGKAKVLIDGDNIVDHGSCLPSPKEVATAEIDAIQEQKNNSQPGKSDDVTSQVASLGNEESAMVVEVPSMVNAVSGNEAKPAEETVSVTAEEVGEDKPLNFDEFGSASDLEVLGLERLKVELQSGGLKCGGTLQERAARLFLLKSTPLDKIPKKLLAKK